MENKETRDFSMRVKPKPRYSLYKPEAFEVHYSTPKRGFTTARFRANLLGFRVNLSVVGPEPEKPKASFELTSREFNDITQAAANLVEMLIQHAFGKDTSV